MTCVISFYKHNNPYIEYKPNTLHLHINEEHNQEIMRNNADKILYIQADGPELDVILSQISNIPTAFHYISTKTLNNQPIQIRNQEMKWFGDIAKFIAYNVNFC